MRTAIEALEVVNDLGRAETIHRVRIFEVQRDAGGLHEVELQSHYVTSRGAGLAWSQGTYSTLYGRRRFRPADPGTG